MRRFAVTRVTAMRSVDELKRRGIVAMLAAKAGGIAYENPVWRQDSPDPTIWQAGGVYYEASTSQRILESRDLVYYSHLAFPQFTKAQFFWASPPRS